MRFLCVALVACLAAGQADEPDCTAVVCTTDLCWDGSNHTQINGKGECCQCPPKQDLRVDGNFVLGPEGTERCVAMQADTANGNVYAATKTKILQFNETLELQVTLDLAQMNFEEITALAVTADAVFVTARLGTAYHLVRLPLAPDGVTLIGAIQQGIESESGIPYALVADAGTQAVYTGHAAHDDGGAFVHKWSMTTCEHVKNITMPAACNDVRGMEFNAKYDAAYMYVNCFTSPGMVVKVELNQKFEVVAENGHLELHAGENELLSGAEQDENFIFVGTATSPGRVVKIRKSDMSHQGALTLEDDEKVIAAMDSDYLSVYATTNTLPAKVVRINKGTMQSEARVALDFSSNVFEQDGISAITHIRDRIYIGADMTPPRFQKLNPGSFYVPKDCELSPWGGWSNCDASVFGRSCGRGVTERNRTMLHENTPGGEPCLKSESHALLLNERKMCSMATACTDGEELHNCPSGSGMVWNETGVLRKDGVESGSRPRCSDRTSNFALVEQAACACPTSHPYWLFSTRCANTTQCDAAHEKECSHVKCMYVAGRVKVLHHRNETFGGGVTCRYTGGRAGACKCFCQTKADSPSDASYNAPLPTTTTMPTTTTTLQTTTTTQ